MHLLQLRQLGLGSGLELGWELAPLGGLQMPEGGLVRPLGQVRVVWVVCLLLPMPLLLPGSRSPPRTGVERGLQAQC